MMEEKLQRLLSNKGTPEWCGLLEMVIGQIGNYMIRKWDYELAEKYHPDIFKFTVEDFMRAERVEDIPKDWLAYVYACMESVGL